MCFLDVFSAFKTLGKQVESGGVRSWWCWWWLLYMHIYIYITTITFHIMKILVILMTRFAWQICMMMEWYGSIYWCFNQMLKFWLGDTSPCRCRQFGCLVHRVKRLSIPWDDCISTPLKIKMEAKNHHVEKEIIFQFQTSIFGFHVNLPGCTYMNRWCSFGKLVGTYTFHPMDASWGQMFSSLFCFEMMTLG